MPVYYRGDNVFDFLFAFLQSTPLSEKGSSLKRNKHASNWSKFFPFKIDNYDTFTSLENTPIPLNKRPFERRYNQGADQAAQKALCLGLRTVSTDLTLYKAHISFKTFSCVTDNISCHKSLD